MKWFDSPLKKFAATLLLLLLLPPLQSRLAYGVWNPFALPEHLTCCMRQYRVSHLPPKDVPPSDCAAISKRDNRTRYALYAPPRTGNAVPTVVYLHEFSGGYYTYALSGSP